MAMWGKETTLLGIHGVGCEIRPSRASGICRVVCSAGCFFWGVKLVCCEVRAAFLVPATEAHELMRVVRSAVQWMFVGVGSCDLEFCFTRTKV